MLTGHWDSVQSDREDEAHTVLEDFKLSGRCGLKSKIKVGDLLTCHIEAVLLSACMT